MAIHEANSFMHRLFSLPAVSLVYYNILVKYILVDVGKNFRRIDEFHFCVCYSFGESLTSVKGVDKTL